ncbi:MAG: phage GP46 family protein [Hyphomicrobium sp.]|nr:phage GP46 family protein [Hyphomicrobium sp.]
MTERFVDCAYVEQADGIYDLAVDPATGDLALEEGLASALFVSLFSDRRAREDEVADPMRRRGWIGNLVAEVPGDNHGSGFWLYEQRRLTGEVASGVRLEAEIALEWMVDARLIRTATAEVLADPARRRITLSVEVTEPDGGTSSRAYELADATRQSILARL